MARKRMATVKRWKRIVLNGRAWQGKSIDCIATEQHRIAEPRISHDTLRIGSVQRRNALIGEGIAQ